MRSETGRLENIGGVGIDLCFMIKDLVGMTKAQVGMNKGEQRSESASVVPPDELATCATAKGDSAHIVCPLRRTYGRNVPSRRPLT